MKTYKTLPLAIAVVLTLLFAPSGLPRAFGDGITTTAMTSLSPARLSLTNPTLEQEPVYNTAFITDGQFEEYQSMNTDSIRDFLTQKGSYLRNRIIDTDNVEFDPAITIADIAVKYKVNPRVIIATIQKESSAITMSTRPNLGWLTGCGGASTARAQIECAARTFRNQFNNITSRGVTSNGWGVGITKLTQDGVSVKPATKAVAIQFSYTPYAGSNWGGAHGGVYLFYRVWNDFGFNVPPIVYECNLGRDGIELYAEKNYQGRCVFYTGDEPDLSNQNFNDDAASIRFVGTYATDWQAILYENPNYGIITSPEYQETGVHSNFQTDHADFDQKTIQQNRTSSLRIWRCVHGQEVTDTFFSQVISKLIQVEHDQGDPGYTINDQTFAAARLFEWIDAENTNACWNPTSTTWPSPGQEPWSGLWANYNNAGVKTFRDQDAGVRATAATLSIVNTDNPHVSAIRDMLAQQGFNKQEVEKALQCWSDGCDKPLSLGYKNLLNKWEKAYVPPTEIKSASAGNTNECIDIKEQSLINGAIIHQWECLNIASQKWQIKPITVYFLGLFPQRYYEIISVKSRKCLDVLDWSQADGAQIVQWDCHGGNNQLWRIEKVGSNNYYRIVSVNRPWFNPFFRDKCLDIVGGDAEPNGDLIQQFSCEANDEQQRWTFSQEAIITGSGSARATRIFPGETQQFIITVPSDLASATFATTWPGSDVVMSLTDPVGRPIDRSTIAPDVIHTHPVGSTYEVYTILTPKPGDWVISLYGADVAPEGEDVILTFDTVAEGAPPAPKLAHLEGETLVLNMGTEERRQARHIQTDETNEAFVVKQLTPELPGDFSVTAFGVTQIYAGVSNILADGDSGNDVISLETISDGISNSVPFTAPAELHGGDDDDQIHSGDGDDALSGDSGNDEITGGGGADAITGDDGDDTLSGGGGSDTLSGGRGNDTINGDSGDDHIQGGDDNDTLHGGSDNDTINGDAGDDQIEGDDGDDFLYGDETLACNVDGSILNAGNSGNASTSTPTPSLGPYVIYLGLIFNNASPNQAPAAGPGGSDEINGGAGNDHIFGGGQADTLNGNDGDDEICGNGGNDTLHGDAGDDVMHGGAGDDHMEGNDGADTMHGDNGNDEMLGQAGPDKMYGDAGDDLMNGGVGDDYMEGNDGADTMHGDDGNDEMYGGGDRDMMYGNAGDDMMHGGAGDDYMEGNDGADTMHGDDGNDEMHGQADADEMYGDADRDTMYGNAGNDMMHGGAGDDYMEGNPDHDTMYGDDGQDDMIGGTSTAGMSDGQDTLYGGADHDVMVGDNASIARPLNGIRDTFSANAADVVRRTIVLFDVATTSSNPSSGAYGNDQMYGEGGADIMYGQGGNDAMSGGPNEDHMEGNAGSDTMHGDAGQDDMIGGTGRINDDPLQGVNSRLDGDDQMYGESDASDGLADGDGADVMLGDNGIIARPLDANGAWQVRPADGAFVRTVTLLDVEILTDSVDPAVHGDDTIFGNDNDDTLYGQGGEDQMHGGAGGDYMEGNASSDLMFGDGGDDDMLGGTGPTTSNDPSTALPGRIDASTLTRTVPRGTNPAASVPLGDTMYGGEGSDVMLGDNGIITRPVDDKGQWITLNYSLLEDTIGDVAPRHTTSGSGARVDRRVQFLDLEPGMTAGSDLMYGGPGEDDMYGQFDDTNRSAHPVIGDEMLGEEGEDAMIGDLGIVDNWVITSETQTIRPPEPFIDDDIFVHGTLFRQVTLLQIETGGDDRMLGGPGGDWMHGGAGNDLMNGNSGNDRLFGDDGTDVMWGGPQHDHLWGGYDDDYLDVKPRPAMTIGNGKQGKGNPRTILADPLEWFSFGGEDNFQNIDYIYGGWDQDAMQADVADTGPVPGDRLIDWVGAYNVYYLCPGLYGEYVITRDHSPHIVSFLQNLAAGDGAVDTVNIGSSGFDEIAIVFSGDIRRNSHPPHQDNPGHFTCGQTP